MPSQALNPVPIDRELADRLERDDSFRRRYIRFFAQSEVAAEIRSLRKRRKMRQVEVAKLSKTGQSAISRIEKADYDGWTFKTLISIAEGLRARLRIRFEPMEDVVDGYRNAATTGDSSRTQGDLEDAGDTSDAADIDFGGETGGDMTDGDTTEQPQWIQ